MLKHPMLVAFKAWTVAHLLASGTLAAIFLFGAFLVWAVADRIAVKRRSGSDNPQLPATRLNDKIVIVAGLVIYLALVFWLHPILFSVPAVRM